MAEAAAVVDTRSQLSAIANLRWRLFSNSLRNTRGQLEFISRIFISIALAIGGLGGAFGMGMGAYLMINAGRPEFIALLLWFVLIFWQVFPILATAFANNPDSSDLLRFPLSYRSYFLVRLAYGAFDPATALGSLWTFGILLGTGFAKPEVLPWAVLVLLAFALFNLLLMQMIFAWVERWLAQRRTRELMGILFLLLMLSFQLIGPLTAHFERRSRGRDVHRFIDVLAPVQGVLPPGLAGDAVAQAMYPHFMPAASSLALLLAYVLLAGYGLHWRLRAQYRGENLSEAPAASTQAQDHSLRFGWNLPGLPAPISAVFEKEIRYLLRSGPLLLNLMMPLFFLAIFRVGMMNPERRSAGFLSRTPDLAFPVVAGYGLLMLSNLFCNTFGGDAGGIQFFLAAPVRFREIILAKNLAHVSMLAVETFLAWIAVVFFYGRPAFDVIIATLAGLVFAVPVNLAGGNMLSIYSPRKVDYSSFRRQNASQTSVLISMCVQLFSVGLGGLAFWLARTHGSFWIATAILLVLAGFSVAGYRIVLNRIDGLARRRQETLVAELCRA